MNVQMKHRLACLRAVVDHQAVAIDDSFLFCQPAGDEEQFAQQHSVFRLDAVHAGNVAIGHDEDVNRGLRAQVPESGHIIVLVEDMSLSVTRYDAAKDTVVH